MAMDKATKWTEATGEVLVQTTYSGGGVHCLLYPRERFLVVPSSADPLVLDLVVIEHQNESGSVTHYEVWTDGEKARLNSAFKEDNRTVDGQKIDAIQENPYQIVPFFCMHAEYPAAEFWHGHTSDDLVQACLAMGVDLTDFGHIKHFQSYLRLFINKGGTEKTGAQVYKSDPSAVLEGSGPYADAKVLNMQANLSVMLEVILKKAQFTVGLRGLRPILVEGGENAESGYALSIREHAKEEGWSRLRQLRTLDEKKMWDIARVVVPAQGGPEIPEGELIITWPELGPGGNPLERAQYVAFVKEILGEEESLRELGKTPEEISVIKGNKAASTPTETVETTGGPLL